MRQPPKAISIKDIGLRKYLDDSMPIHNSFGYDSFAMMVERDIPKASIAKLLGVGRNTVIKWVKIYNAKA